MKSQFLKNQKWIIFYQVDGIKYYFVKFYKIGRPKFSTSCYTVYDNVFELNDDLQTLEAMKDTYLKSKEPIKLYAGAIDSSTPTNKERK